MEETKTALDNRQESGEVHGIASELVPKTSSVSISSPTSRPANYPQITEGTIDCLGSEREMILSAYTDLNKVLSSHQFKDEVLKAEFTETNGLSNEAIYDLAVQKSPVAVDFKMYQGSFWANYHWHTMGYEDPNYPTVCFANRHFIQDKEVCASLILHETMHILGFSHYEVMGTSVPYTMNRIYDIVAIALNLASEQPQSTGA